MPVLESKLCFFDTETTGTRPGHDEVNASTHLCLERAYRDNREDLIPIIGHMAEKFEPLEEDEVRYDPAMLGVD